MKKELLAFEGMKRILALLFGFTVVQGVSIILQAKWLAEVVTRLFQQEAFQEVYETLLLFIGAFLMRHFLQHVKQKMVYEYSVKLGAHLRKEVLDALFHLGPKVARRLGTGNAVTLLQEGVSQFKQYLSLFLPKMVNMAIIPAMVWLYVLLLDRTSAVILMVTLPLLVIFMILLGLAAKKKADKQWKVYRVLANHFVDSLRGLETLKYLGRSQAHTQNIQSVSERYRKATMGTLKIAFLSSFALDFFTMLSVATVAVFLGLRLVDGEMTLWPALTILILAPEYFLPVREIGADYHATLNGQEAGRKLKEIVDLPRFREEGTCKLERWNHQQELQLNGITVRHEEGGPPSLKGVTLSVKGFQKIGIVGESGAGKSTLIDVMGGFVQAQEGTIQIGGQEMTHLQKKDWQSQLLYIPQHPYIFHDTLWNNLTFYQPHATAEEVRTAVEKAGLGELVQRIPNGLHEKIGEGGRALSGGEAQRVALARAFLGKRPILLLDEPTAHLDVETELDIKEKMLELFCGKLVFLATHRLHWMPHMDHIYFLKDGEIVEEGTHQQLMERKGHYYQMAKAHWGDQA
ncbi:thiol reductant ABC exporter subunit CydD [Anoxybacteroides rupiense]|uniref:thiol reductant ABC exporter subunit CydD n=1 Tax=Anoxybacteroides rupiense TaxID=311460 RepID=UPI001F0940CA|nr:thiol reductant ABC exporter subunit CydD [Anoxybacillus rupiensis]